MIRIKLIHLTLILWCCVLYDKTKVECHRENVVPEVRYKRLIDDKDSLKGLVLEALELENNFSELKKAMNVTAPYQELLDRVNRLRSQGGNEDDERALAQLKLILRQKLNDLEEDTGLIVDIDSYADLVASKISLRNRLIPALTNINDVDLENNLNQLRFRANGNFILKEYQRYIEGFRLTYFPHAACYLEALDLPTSPTAYDNLNAMTLAFTNSLNESKRHSEHIKLKDVNYLGGSNQEDAFYIWKNSDVRDKIRQLFKGEKTTLLADIKNATQQLDALKFNKLEFVFRSSNRTANKQLNRALKAFGIRLLHSGRSAFRYKNHLYQLTSEPLLIYFAYEKTRQQLPTHRNGVYTKLQRNRPVLSPYTEFELQLVELVSERFEGLTQFEQLDVDIELHGSGSYVDNNLSICEQEKMSTFYTQINNQ